MDIARLASQDLRGSATSPTPIDKLPESLERALERVMGVWHGRIFDSLLEIRERTRESFNLVSSNGEHIHDLQEMNGQLYKKIKQQGEDLKILRDEVTVRLDNQAEDIKAIKHELARLREAIYYSINSVKEETRQDSSSRNRWFRRDER